MRTALALLLLLLLQLLLAPVRRAQDGEGAAYYAVVRCDAVLDGFAAPAYVHRVPGSAHCVAVWHGLPDDDAAYRAAVADSVAVPAAHLVRDTLVHAQLHRPPPTWAGTTCRTNRAGAPGAERGYAGGAFSWGLDRLDGRVLDAHFCAPYAGADVDLYVVDTGVDPHASFAHPVRQGFSSYAPGGVPDPADPDCNGHGTHVAGIAASAVYGAAPDARVTAVQVLGCSGSGPNSGVTAGLLWIEADRAARPPGTRRGCVVNLSLGSRNSFNPAVAALYARLRDEQGCTVVAAAGNSALDACTFYPAAYDAVVAVGATDEADRLVRTARWGSNHGPCVALSAPGYAIVSAQGSDGGYAIKSGTSMASPFVAGVLAILYDEHLVASGHEPTAAPVLDALLARAVEAVRAPVPAGTPRLLAQAVPGRASSAPGEVAPDLRVLYTGLLALALVVPRLG